eukprot:TRINITY_DN27266_c0_g2_i1.p1 TRINITY_DN27266_c0_g2~~TRINITY_DN27266_c0_g2_i1.p1  ORF type:complete len:474 (+),score=65.56 TRINITY_DN27266_c0_g2_i1:178-1422(+)
MPEMGWSVCEPLVMPLLLQLNVPTELLASCWLVSPVLGLFLHPVVGSLSDVHGRRLFITIFGLVAVCGLILTPLSVLLPVPTNAIVVLIAFGFTDLCHDLLLTPTRAAMNDVFADAEVSERRSAMAGGIGKLLALFCATFLNRTAAFYSVAAMLLLAVLLQFILAGDESTKRRSVSYSFLALEEDRKEEHGESVLNLCRLRGLPQGFAYIWWCSFCGWLAICIFSFYFTSVWAERMTTEPPGSANFDAAVQMATALLIGSAFVFLAGGYALNGVVRCCGGEGNAMAVAVVVLSAGLASCDNAVPVAFPVAFVVFLMPVAYQVVANTPFAWLEKQDAFDEKIRGKCTGVLNSSLALAQALVAVASGPVVAWAKGRLLAAYWATVIVNAVILMSALLCTLRGKGASDSSKREPLLT